MDFLKRYKLLGHNFVDVQLRQSIRCNTLKISNSNLVTRLKNRKVKLEKVKFTANGFYASSKFSLGATSEYLQGLYYIQEAASQVPVQILCPGKGDTVLDACAAPGGKTTQMSQYMLNSGEIIALDVKTSRLDALIFNNARLGVKNTTVYELDVLNVNELNTMFDKILVDAPCSGNLVDDSKWLSKRTIEGVLKKAAEQKNIVKSCAKVLKRNGEMVYSTCSLEPEEDEEVVKFAIERCGMKLIKIGGYAKFENSSLPGTLKFWPDVSGTQGFFIAKLGKVN